MKEISFMCDLGGKQLNKTNNKIHDNIIIIVNMFEHSIVSPKSTFRWRHYVLNKTSHRSVLYIYTNSEKITKHR